MSIVNCAGPIFSPGKLDFDDLPRPNGYVPLNEHLHHARTMSSVDSVHALGLENLRGPIIKV